MAGSGVGDRHKAQRNRRTPTSGTNRAGGFASFTEPLVERYRDDSPEQDEEYPYPSPAGRRTSQREQMNSKYDAIESKIHDRRRGAPEELWPWWRRRRRRVLIILACSLVVCFVIPKRREMRQIEFPGMPVIIEQQYAHVVRRQEVREDDRPRAHMSKKKKKKEHQKSAFRNLHLRLLSDTDDVEADDLESTELDDEDDSAAELSPEYSPNDPDAPPVYGMSHFKDTHEKYFKTQIPIFWHIPKSGGSTIKDVAGACHQLVTASNVGTLDKIVGPGHGNDTSPQIVSGRGGSHFVNINTHSLEGIQHAKEIGFPTSGMAEIIVSTFVREANALGSPPHMLRFFAIFRHPIERAISMFYYIQVASWEKTYHPELQNWTIEEYALSTIAENNWMTRQLANNPTGELDDGDLAIANEVLRRKFFIGLIDKMEESMDRFERFFRWTYKVNPTSQEACRDRLLTGEGGSNRNVNATKKAHPKEGTRGWELLAEKNRYDLQLYEYARELFDEQENLLDASHPKGYRRIKETCCKCNPPTYPVGGFDCP